MILYDYEIDSYLGAEPASLSDLQLRSNLLRKNLEERSARGFRLVATVPFGKSQSLVFERPSKNLEWKKASFEDGAELSADGWFEHSRAGMEVTFFRKKKTP